MRRSRLAVRPNLGPKVGARGASSTAEDKKNDSKKKDTEVLKGEIQKEQTGHKLQIEGTSSVDEVKTESVVADVKISSPAPAVKAASTAENGPSLPNIPKEDKGHKKPVASSPVSGEKDKKDEGEKKPVADTAAAETKQNAVESEVKKPAVPRRSRFPKAKPNLSDAGRQRSRKPSISISDNEEETRRHPPTVHRTAPLKVSQGQAIPSNPPGVAPKESTSLDNAETPLSETDKLVEGSSNTTPLKPTQDKSGKKVEELPPPKKEVKKRYKVNWGDEPPDRSKMTMRDLIHWNPSRNPMKYTDSKKKKVMASPKENIVGATEGEKQLDDQDDNMSVSGKSDQVEDDMPVPQVMIGPDGQIILNQKSLVIESTPPRLIESSEGEVVNEDEMTTTYASFRKRTLTKTWTQKETTKFYTALSAVGTDFSLIHQLFPKRTRTEIKNKFKKEERVNKYLIDKALRERRHFDMAMFEKQSESEEEEEVKKKGGRKRKKSLEEKENPKGKQADKKTKKRKKKAANSDEEDGDLSDATTIDDNASVMSEVASIADDDSDEENIHLDGILKTTRSGRQPKKVDNTMYLPAKELASRLRCRSASISSETSEKAINDLTPGRPGAQTPTRVFQVPNNLVNINEMNPLSPGKVMILTNREIVGTGADAKEVIHVFMVTPNQSPQPGGAVSGVMGSPVMHQLPITAGQSPLARLPGHSISSPTAVHARPVQLNQLNQLPGQFRMPFNVGPRQGSIPGRSPTHSSAMPYFGQNRTIPATVSAPPASDNVAPISPRMVLLNQAGQFGQVVHGGPGNSPTSFKHNHAVNPSGTPQNMPKTNINTVNLQPHQNYTINQGKVMPGHSGGTQGQTISPPLAAAGDTISESMAQSDEPLSQCTVRPDEYYINLGELSANERTRTEVGSGKNQTCKPATVTIDVSGSKSSTSELESQIVFDAVGSTDLSKATENAQNVLTTTENASSLITSSNLDSESAMLVKRSVDGRDENKSLRPEMSFMLRDKTGNIVNTNAKAEILFDMVQCKEETDSVVIETEGQVIPPVVHTEEAANAEPEN